MTVPEEMAVEVANKKAEREALRGVIQQWNANRLDLFELSEPNESLEFHGVMRFYFQDSGQKVATKCIRVASDATSQAVIETLIEKFRPDMRMLSIPEYALYEIHENGEERKLELEEKPLLVQLNWHIDDREGRFLLRRIDDKTNTQGVGFSTTEGSSFRRKLSKREKKQIKKQEKLSRMKSLEHDENTITVDQNGVAEKLYTELPETSFTRSISNPEAVMRRRRQQKLEKKLQQFRSKDGGPDTGGTLKIYGEALCKDVPYKTLLLSVRDSAAQVVREMLSKYGLDKADPQQYCLVQVHGETTNNGHQEYILDEDECPLAILMNHPSTRGSIMFHVRRRPADYVPRKRKKKPTGKWNEPDYRYEDERLPFLLELNPDGTDIPNGSGVRHRLQPNVTEVGSERPIGPHAIQAQTLTLTGPTVMPRHCVIAFTDNIVTLTPCSRDAHTYVNNQRIHQTTILQNGAIVKFGRLHTFRFIDPAPEDRIRQRQDSSRQTDYAFDRRSPDRNSQDVSSEKYRSGSETPNGDQSQGVGQGSIPPSPTKTGNNCSRRSSTHGNLSTEPTTPHNYETTFDVDGNVETASLTSSRDGNRMQHFDRPIRGSDPILPAVLEFLEETEEAFFHAVITDVEPSAPQFKLAPTYTLYLAARYRASTHYRPELQPTERAHRLTVMLANVATMIQRVIQERYMDASSLAFWLANGSELLHMLKSDRHVGAFSTRAQDILTDAVHRAFESLAHCVSLELVPAMSQFMADADEPAKEAGVLQIFSNTMALLRRCRVNAALTIQLFSHLFHTINATAFNALVSNGNLCVRWFGRRLKARLNALETWAERQGLEFASQCHLATIMQATHLLQAPKYNAEELATLSSTCFKLNSLQVRALLQKYQPAADEPRLPAELIENVVRVAESVADTLARADGREIRLEEELTLTLALLLPDEGYTCEVIRGVPPGLAEFLAPLQRDGLCRMAPQPTSSGYWTIYMIDHNSLRSPSAMSNRSGGYSVQSGGQNQCQPEIQMIKLHKSTNGMGLSIVAAKGTGQDRLGIYIKSVVAGGAADADGRLTAGDQLLKVDGQSLVGITQEKAAEYLVRTGPTVTLEVAKQGAIYHGLATLLSQPSPIMTRAHKSSRPKSENLEPTRVPSLMREAGHQPSSSHSLGNLLTVPKQNLPSQEVPLNMDPMIVGSIQPGPRRMSERDLPSRFGHDVTPHQQIHSSKSVPALHNVGTEIKQQHEVFNPGYSRASSSNSMTPPVQQPPPMPNMGGATSLRSRSSHNLHDPMRAGTLPPSGLVNRQQSSPNLNPNNQSHAHMNLQNTAQNSEAERFYQNLSVYRNHDPIMKQSKATNPQQYLDLDRSLVYGQRNLRGSQNSLNRPTIAHETTQGRERPISAYIPQNPQQIQLHSQSSPPPARAQSSRDIIRQEAKLQEMQEEVRRRELRGAAPPPPLPPSMLQQQYRLNDRYTNYSSSSLTSNVPIGRGGPIMSSRTLDRSSINPNIRPMGPGSACFNSPENQYGQYSVGAQYGQYGKPQSPMGPYSLPSKGDNHHVSATLNLPISPELRAKIASADNNVAGSYVEYNRKSQIFQQAHSHYSNGGLQPDVRMSQSEIRNDNDLTQTTHHSNFSEEAYTPPPPTPNTATHPLYTTKQPDPSRYTASMQDPPRGGYYPTNMGTPTSQQPRQYQYSATNPWQREEREKEQARRREAARQWRDQQILELGTLAHRTSQQEDQLRALQLERDFQKRAEEAANQQDDDEESNDLDNESVQRVQGLLRMATAQDKINQSNSQQQQNVFRTTAGGTQSNRVPPFPSQVQFNQKDSRHPGSGSYVVGQSTENLDSSQQHKGQNQNNIPTQMQSPNYVMSFAATQQQPQQQFETGQKHASYDLSQMNNQEKSNVDENKRKYPELDDTQKRVGEEENRRQRQQLHLQQTYQQQQYFRNQQQLHPGVLRFDNLSINSPNASLTSQHNSNEIPPPPERGSSYAAMCQQSALKTNNVVTSPTLLNASLNAQQSPAVKRVSFHDSNANTEIVPRNLNLSENQINASLAMETIREDPNNFINEAEHLLASPTTPEGPGGLYVGSTPGVIGAQEVYKDPRQKRLAEKQKQQQNLQMGAVPEKLSFKEKIKMFALETGEDGTPRDKVKISRAQREIDNIGSSLNANNNINNNRS